MGVVDAALASPHTAASDGSLSLVRCDHDDDPSRVVAFAGMDNRRPRMTLHLDVVIVAMMALMVLLLVTQGAAGEQGWSHLQQYWGQVQSIKVDKCGQRPGLCEGKIVLTPGHGSKVILSIRPGMWIKRGDHLVPLEELRAGDEIHVQAYEIGGAEATQEAK
jgi:hypothetical protein